MDALGVALEVVVLNDEIGFELCIICLGVASFDGDGSAATVEYGVATNLTVECGYRGRKRLKIGKSSVLWSFSMQSLLAFRIRSFCHRKPTTTRSSTLCSNCSASQSLPNPFTLLGIAFDKEKKAIGEWVSELLSY